MFTPFKSVFRRCTFGLDHSTQSVDWSQSGRHIWTLQFDLILLCKTAQAPSGVGCEQAFSGPATKVLGYSIFMSKKPNYIDQNAIYKSNKRGKHTRDEYFL